ncbi:MAG: BlaI/MecI/CopY family transcriptional regulator [Acidimicrobiales bacterium]
MSLVDALALGTLERAVMEVLWEGGGWMTPGEVSDALDTTQTRAYTTVSTIVARLWRKGLLERERDGRAHAYRAVQTREEYVASVMDAALGNVDNRTRVLSHFMQGLDRGERDQVRRMLAKGPRDGA